MIGLGRLERHDHLHGLELHIRLSLLDHGTIVMKIADDFTIDIRSQL